MNTLRAFIACVLVFVAAGAAHASSSPPFASSAVRVALVSNANTMAPGRQIYLGLLFSLAPGWHIYWRNPGESGLPPRLDLTLSPGTKAGPILWPPPRRIRQGPVTVFGYTGTVLLPFAVSLGRGPMTATARAEWLVCKNLCLPERAIFHLTLPRGLPQPSAEAPLFARTLAALPAKLLAKAVLGPNGRMVVSSPALSPQTVTSAYFFPNERGRIGVAQQVRVEEGVLAMKFTLEPGWWPKTLSGVLLLQSPDGTSHYADLTVVPGRPPPALALELERALGLAFLGGLILNLMPCVFPVLAVKALGLARLRGVERDRARVSAAAYGAGVLLSFTALAALMLALRGMGAAIGWGFQFSSAVFVVAMAWLMGGIGLAFLGTIPLPAPAFSGKVGGSSFFAGVLAVFLATSCTAPFMATAIGIALAAPLWAVLGIFLALGAGMAAPYVAVALLPPLQLLLPRPGPWMEAFKEFLAFPMFATAVWLSFVASAEAGSQAVAVLGAGFVLLGFAAWAWRRSSRRFRLLAILALAALVPVLGFAAAPPPAKTAAAWKQPFSFSRLAVLRAEGKPVFVDVTAAWCVSCAVNELLVLDRPLIRRAFAKEGVTYLLADWTREPPALTAYLAAHGRAGVPLYVLYPAGDGIGEVLPQILTVPELLAALRQAGAGSGNRTRAFSLGS